jgi:hypothetical protein
MKSIMKLRNNERHVALDDDGGIAGEVVSKDECADVPNTPEPTQTTRSSKQLFLKLFVASLAIAALVLGVFAAFGRKEVDPPSVVSSASVFGNSELRQTG